MANGYPISYLFSTDKSFYPRIQAVRDEVVDSFGLAMGALKPGLSAAFAGPVTFGDRINNHLNRHPESCDWHAMLAEVRRHGPVEWPAPFSRIEYFDGVVTGTELREWGDFRSNSQAGSLPTEEPSLQAIQAAAGQYVERLAAVLRDAGQETNTRLILAAVRDLELVESGAPDWTLELDFTRQTVTECTEAPPPHVQITSIPAILFALVSGKINVDDILLSARARFRRDPDTFDSILHNLMRYGGDPLGSVALARWAQGRAKSTESITIDACGETRRIPRFCPHEGESLEDAPIVDGKLICPRHRWTFDLSTGQCIAGDRGVNLFTLVEQDNGS